MGNLRTKHLGRAGQEEGGGLEPKWDRDEEAEPLIVTPLSYISLYLPIFPYICPYLPVFPHISLYLPISGAQNGMGKQSH